MAKHTDIVNLLKRRIRHGDYGLKQFPSELKLAKEMSVGRSTIRKALLQLIEDGVLTRQPNGRIAVNRSTEDSARHLQLAFLQPSHPSFNAEWYRLAAQRAAADLGAALRPILYLHWHDSFIQDALDGFDGVFFMPLPEAVPDWLIAAFQRYPPGHVVVLDQDLSGSGIQSIRLFPASFVQSLLDHLAELGHRVVDCFNVHPLEPDIVARIEQWRLWKTAHGIGGREFNEAGKHSGWLSDQSYKAMSVLLDKKSIEASAILCTTMSAAVGAMRVMKDRGIVVGKDVSLCTVNDEGIARYLSPSVTALLLPDAGPYMARCIHKIKNNGEEWSCPLLLQLDRVPLFIGESTGKCLKRVKPERTGMGIGTCGSLGSALPRSTERRRIANA
jgi:hypothetical protein